MEDKEQPSIILWDHFHFYNGKAPYFMKEGARYYTSDGIAFIQIMIWKIAADPDISYYKFLPFRTNSVYTASDLDRYIDSLNASGSVLIGQGKAF